MQKTNFDKLEKIDQNNNNTVVDGLMLMEMSEYDVVCLVDDDNQLYAKI